MKASLFRPFGAGFTHEVFTASERQVKPALASLREFEGEEPPTLAFDVIGQYTEMVDGEFVRTRPDSVQFGSAEPIALPSTPQKTVPLVLDQTAYVAVQGEDETLRLVGKDGIAGEWPFALHQVQLSDQGALLKAHDGAVLAFEVGAWEARSTLEVDPKADPEVGFEEDWLTVGDAAVPRS